MWGMHARAHTRAMWREVWQDSDMWTQLRHPMCRDMSAMQQEVYLQVQTLTVFKEVWRTLHTVQVALPISQSLLLSSDRMKPRSGDWAVTIDFLQEATITSLSSGNNEPCSWGCVHTKCTKRCHEPCDREACIEPCKEILRCKHPCIGFCGDPCPPLCRVCDEDMVTAIFFGFEDEENARLVGCDWKQIYLYRYHISIYLFGGNNWSLKTWFVHCCRFVYLEDCKHTVESQGLEGWLEQTESEISMKVCPFCKTPITKTQRYTNLIKAVYQDVCKVKAKVFGDMKDIEASRGHLQQQLANLRPELLVRYGIVKEFDLSKASHSQLLTVDDGEMGFEPRLPKGHVYSIGNCGMPIQLEKCIECGAEIGGTNHTLVGSNQMLNDM
uniref:(California timema) hypothetical protein n=1 Tax=Timema californicum TaxID=61474 RepID=A0A7R9JA28_TIMCA|nr:unnamed protein product [Timema californicum]